MTNDPLSSLDGRYEHETSPLRNYFSEAAYFRERVRVETDYLIALSRDVRLIRPLTNQEEQSLRHLVVDFSNESKREIKEFERRTHHDVKALEYFLRARIAETSMADISEWIHFGLTSEDVNQTAQAIALRDSRDAVILPALGRLIIALAALARRYQHTPMLARTHGQPAVPTTLGKEFAVYLVRLQKQCIRIRDHQFEAKLNGAVGNFNALVAAAPEVDWIKFSARFIHSYGLEPSFLTTQLMPYDNWVAYFDLLRTVNSILIDLSQDLWQYISRDYLTTPAVPTEVGSSTMPHKVNPIDFENAEGNLGLANALLLHYAQKLPISRLQRDLSDSTVRRTFGMALGHTLLAYTNLLRGLDKLVANEQKMAADLESQWQVISEGSQTLLRAAGFSQAYEELKTLTRGKTISRIEYEQWVDNLAVDDTIKDRLKALTPLTYLGLAEQLVENALNTEM